MQQLIKQIEQWAEERNLIKGSTPQKQMLKLMEEFGELCGGIAKNKPEVIKDSIGDCFVVITILMAQLGHPWSEEDCTWDLDDDTDKTDGTVFDEIMRFANYIEYLDPQIEDSDGWFVFGEIYSPITMIAHMFDFTMMECVQHAYDQIKDRKGKMVDGIWVKEEDL